ncbi:MAG TPA: hypothetical protein VL371_01940 [Gemmataceae bacterium]|nr:hypothetical protein [Gemmataceae bacterium]
MKFSEQPPSRQWAALTFQGERIAEVWFKPDDEPFSLIFRIPRTSFQIPGIGHRLTTANLLKAVAIAADEVESWQHVGAVRSDTELTKPLPQPAEDVPHLEILVRLKPSPQAVDEQDGHDAEVASADWHDLAAQWKTILGLEAAVDTMRKSMEGLRAELEASMRRTLTADEKVYALSADMVQWNKAKSRAHYALPKASEFIHRATWAAGTPERKRLGEIFKDTVGPESSLPPAAEVSQELEMLRKDRQVLSQKGVTVYQECKAIAADIQRTLRTLQGNAASRASLKKGGTGAKGK